MGTCSGSSGCQTNGDSVSTAKQKLLEQVRLQPFVPQDCSTACLREGESVRYLPAYIPYIGLQYFDYRPRILCYAINQNLSQHAPWTNDWLSSWIDDIEIAIDRLNIAADRGEPIPIKPYAEGFIPLLALVAIHLWLNLHGGSLPDSIDDVISVTNFVKFSTSSDAQSSSIPTSWWRECGEHYVRNELDILKPDILIVIGSRTSKEIQRLLQSDEIYEDTPVLLHSRFPSRIPSHASKPLTTSETKLWESTIMPLINRIRRPCLASYCKFRCNNFPLYFINAHDNWNRSTLINHEK